MVACFLVGVALTTPTRYSSAPRRKTWLVFIVLSPHWLGRISISKTLSDLHWLPMKFRVDFKVATLTFKVIESGEPGYLYSRISIAFSRRTLRSSAETFCDSIKDHDWRTSFSTLGTVVLKQSAT